MTDPTLERFGAMSTEQCAAEPIHQPGGIQPHGCLLLLAPEDLRVLGHSINTAAFLGLPGDDLIGRTAAACAGDTIGAWLRHLVEDGAWAHDTHAVTEISWTTGRLLVATAHCHDQLIQLELEKVDQGAARLAQMTLDNEVLPALARIRAADSLEDLAQGVADTLRSITRFERVLIYRFDPEGHGAVIAESRAPNWNQSFLGFHFPASDIPAQARALYHHSLQRFVPDRDYEPVPLTPTVNPRTGAPFDLSLARLRALSPVHQVYQRNLGVNGAMSLSIMDKDRLWGLVVGHHRKRHTVPPAARSAAMMITEAFGLRIGATQTTAEQTARTRHNERHARLLEQIAGARDLSDALGRGPVHLTDLFQGVSGAAVLRTLDDGSTDVRLIADTPPESAVRDLARWLRRRMGTEHLYATHCLGAEYPEFARWADRASGVLAILVGEASQHMIVWFRPELVRTLNWGGCPDKSVQAADGPMPLLPRRSFERWVEVKRGQAQPWPRWKLDIAESLRVALNDLILRQMHAVKELNARLAAVSQAKSDFLARMSHELRTPLNAVLGFSDMLAREVAGPLNSRQHGYVADIHRAGHLLLDLINDVLDLSKVEAGRFDLSEQDLDLDGLTRDVVQALSPMIAEKNLTVARAVPENLPALVADPRLVRQMLINVINNAVTFTPAGGRISLTVERQENGGLGIRIRDSGPGIPAEQVCRVLEAFHQGPSEITEPRAGTGLGLAIVRSLIQLHQGSLTLDSTVGQGTIVTLNFPAERLTPAG